MMNKLLISTSTTALVTMGILATGNPARAVNVITNGGFETGDLTGWTVTNQAGGSGSFFVSSSTSTPLSGNSTVGPASGSFYAVSDQTGPGAHALWQAFTVSGPGQSISLSYDMFVNDRSGVGPIINPAGLDYSASPNQHARVDILAASANPLSTNAADVLANFYLGVDPSASNPNPYTSYNFDISSVVGGGGTYILRFAEVDNQSFLNQGVDNVMINTVAVPWETDTLPVVGSTVILGLGLWAKRDTLETNLRIIHKPLDNWIVRSSLS